MSENAPKVSLREVTPENLYQVCALRVAPHQEGFVAPNAYSIAQAYFEREAAWFRAIYADETPVGFLMLDDDPNSQEYALWRFMIADEHQGKGYGRQAIALLLDHVRTRPGAKELLTSYLPGEGNPGGFYRKLGFQETGDLQEGEIIVRLPL
jgi:diamine N-acetyltransferase